ncbi:HD domain-containing protein [Algoriphagus hitonicola]|uniref:Phosphonate degradation operons associated HDIG domain protein n=1 Tax=Algoriphagus hitonicola TaxID=435880 RepID=A0A1I2XIH1_9BACT|nr:HD domain-containing protein [Algoriphagus hitonicola]SFH13202.1 phosphonate degradation operons associated HDIG domain protein [Algoriphagus hitonicola]
MNLSHLSIDQKLDLIFNLYDKHGNEDYIGEPVSQLEHMYQSALLAQSEGRDEQVVLAAFFHDIGHLITHLIKTDSMSGFGVKRHEIIGANFLRELGFPEKIALLVENHVQAKRYLTFISPDYYQLLSEASRQTLRYQGGPMNEKEAQDFENHELFKLSLAMRKWDEEAKEENIPVGNLHTFREMAFHILSTASDSEKKSDL